MYKRQHLIGLDPGYRTADEGELKLLRGDVVKALLEEYYAKKDEKFQKFVECFATGKSDENLGNLIPVSCLLYTSRCV